VDDPISVKAQQTGAGQLGSTIGVALTGQYAVAGGKCQDYTKGVICWSAATGAHEVHGSIYARYKASGSAGGPLGFPTSDEKRSPDGVGRYNHFSGSGGASIYWTAANGAHEVHGLIRAKWASLGWEAGPLGYPVTDETRTPDGVGLYNNFSGSGGASIYWTAATGAHEIHGAIRAKWASMGMETGLGYPANDETRTLDGVGRHNQFSRGGNMSSIFWSPATGAHAVFGAIRAKWAELGWERSKLGYPTTDEKGTSDGVGRYNHFSGSGGGSIFWTPATGAHEVRGLVRAKWAALGWETGKLGYPVSDEMGTLDGVGRYNQFAGSNGSSIFWSPATGAHEVRGAIRARWAALGWERSSLGYPVSDEYSVPEGRASDFRNGRLVWNSKTGAVSG
jgi:uncharacterized protein with LGFP repeats